MKGLTPTMKNKILFVVLLLLVFTLGILSVKAWDEYKVQQKIQAKTAQLEAQAKQQDALKREQARTKAEAAEKLRIKTQCDAGLKAYNALPAAQQKTTPKPNCNLNQVQ